jgi:hypothetical protein
MTAKLERLNYFITIATLASLVLTSGNVLLVLRISVFASAIPEQVVAGFLQQHNQRWH